MDYIYEPATFGVAINPLVRRKRDEINGRVDITQGFGIRPSMEDRQKGNMSMRIEFKEYESTKTNPNPAGKTYPIYRVTGKALSGKMEGQDWNTQVFASAHDMIAQIKGLNKGDIVDVEMKQNGKFWNAQSFIKVEGETADLTVVDRKVKMGVSSSPENNKAHNIRGTMKAMGPMKKGESEADYMLKAGQMADMVQDYVDGKGIFQFDKEAMSNGIPEAEVPPEIVEAA
jgi:hypothetical protein